jgi:hypothetical protein
MPVKYQYLQTGEFYQGVPARDLTDEDFAALSPEAQEAVAGSASVYREVAKKAKDATPPKDDGKKAG